LRKKRKIFACLKILEMALAIRVLQHVVPAYLLAAKEVPQSQASGKHYLIINGLT
jgi:hypothetical protein